MKSFKQYCKEDLSIEELEAKMKKIYEDNKVLVEGEYKVIDG